MEEVPGLKKASHYSEAGSVLVAGGSGGFGKKVGSKGDDVAWSEARKFEPFLAESTPDSPSTATLNEKCRFGECASFTKQLAEHCSCKLGIPVLADTAVHGFHVESGRLVAINT